MRELKNQLYAQVARIGKAVASPKRLEFIELLCQGEKTVEVLAAQADISVKLASAHLKELRLARLVETRKEGKYVQYRLASTSVADLWVNLRSGGRTAGRIASGPRVHRPARRRAGGGRPSFHPEEGQDR